MASILAVRQALAARLETVEGLRVLPYVEGSISPPAATIVPGIGSETSTSRPAIDYDKSFRGAVLMNFLVKIAVSSVADDAAQRKLDAYLDVGTDVSVKDALEAGMEPIYAEEYDDADAPVVADSVLVKGVSHYGMVEWAGTSYLGADLHVEVMAR